ncbi:hypothetical protein J7E37_17685 [Bacillus sp. ISL-39]|nr:hypothetical protein [Bacillus sp. ISL-39]
MRKEKGQGGGRLLLKPFNRSRVYGQNGGERRGNGPIEELYRTNRRGKKGKVFR